MPLRVHPEDASWEFRGAPQVDALRLRVKNPVADYWTFSELNPDYLTQSDGKASHFHPVGDFTVMVRLRLDVTPNNHVLINKTSTVGETGYEWELYFDSSGQLVARVAQSPSTWISTAVSFVFSGPHDMLVALAYDASIGRVHGYVVDTGGATTNFADGSPGAIRDSSAPVHIAARSDLSGTEWPDRIYWWGYVESKLESANLQDIFDNQDTHPMDFGLKAYSDFNDTVGATHTTLIGGYVFTVTGSPVHTGDQGPSWPDPTRTFEPSRFTGDMTVVGAFIPDNVDSGHEVGLIGKWNENGVDQRVWRIRQDEDDVKFAVSKDGTTAGTTEVTVPAVLVAGEVARFAMRYEDKGDGSSDLICEVNGTEVSSSTAVAPVFKSNTADLQIADYDATTAKHFDGKMLWWGFFQRKLTDVETGNLLSYYVRPAQMSGDIVFYDDFHETVGAEKDSTFPETGVYNPFDWKGPIVFRVDGLPVHAGSSESSWDGYQLGPAGFLEDEIQIVFGVSDYPERVYPKVSEKLISEPVSLPDLEEAVQVLTAHPIPERIYPNVSYKDLGPAVSAYRIKSRAGG